MRATFLFLLCCILMPLSCYVQKQQPGHYTLIPEGELRQFLRYDGEVFPMISAHRGGRYIEGYPENAIETFDYVLQQMPSIIECDVVKSKDGVLYMMHDRSLDRTTTGTGKVVDRDWEYVKTLRLVDDFGTTTNFKVPTLEEVLQWIKGKTVITLDVKRGVPFEEVVTQIEAAGAADYVAVITYNFEDAKNVLALNSDLMLSVSIRSMEEWQRFQAAGIPAKNVIAFTGTRRSEPILFETLHQAGILCIQGTMGNIDKQAEAKGEKVYADLVASGIDILATDRPIEAFGAVQALITPQAKRQKYMVRE
ncbi:MAG: glycerophosphodiester phosphodiesterase family protein [Bacteroidota bacterium]